MSDAADPGPTVSVIIPVHNGAAFLRSCLGAVATTDYHSYECIVVDDGSTDGSRRIAAEFPIPVQIVSVADGPRGPAYARNRGAELARGEILFFVDADVVLGPGVLRRVAKVFYEQPDLAAVFGSYDAHPSATGVISQYRNLLHHFVHQNGDSEASTFWAGCGAIRRSAFEELHGFDEKRFPRASIEDIELGYRLRQYGYRILLDKTVQGTHLKQWSLYSLIRTDVTCRAVPWARLILQTNNLPNDLNLKRGQRLSFAFMAMSCAFLPLALIQLELLAASLAGLLGVAILNRKLYLFFFRQGGTLFLAACLPLHALYYLYSGLSYFYVWGGFQLRKVADLSGISAAKQRLTPQEPKR